MKTVWEFVEKYYPKYSSCENIARSNDLEVLIDGEDEEDSCARRLLMTEYDGVRDINILQKDADELNCDIYERAIEGYLKQLNEG